MRFKNFSLKKYRQIAHCLVLIGLLGALVHAQVVGTTNVQGTVYLANGQPVSGSMRISWPAFTTATGQLVAASSATATIGANGFVSVNLAPNQNATPAGLYYTAVYYLSDGSTSTQYWTVPATAQATIAQVQAQVMPAAQAVQSVSKAYVDQAIASLNTGVLTNLGGNLTEPLYLGGDPVQPLQAADKHYVDASITQATALPVGSPMRADLFAGADFGAQLQACLNSLSSTYGGTCDARNFTGNLSIAQNVTISIANATIYLPCATISTKSQIIVTAGTRNATLHGCALRGASAASGNTGGTVFLYSGTGAMVQVGDPSYVADTAGFHMDNAVINTTASSSASAQGLVAYRTQELDLQSLYLLGNANQTGITLDGTGNYTGGTFYDDQLTGFQTAVNAVGHQVANAATTDWMNASTFVRLHINCPTASGSPISGTYGINLQQGDGNTFTGGDVEGCSTALHLGVNAQNNTIVGLRNENSANQVVAESGSNNNSWITGGTMFTGKLTDNGTRNSFLDAFHRSFNGVNGDQYHSQIDSTITNHTQLGIGNGNVRGLETEYQTDVPGTPGSYRYTWLEGLTDGTSGQQSHIVQDMLNNTIRLGIQQNVTPGGNAQSYLNAAGTGNVCFQCAANSGTGGVAFSSGGAAPATVATIDGAGNAQFTGTLQATGQATFANTVEIKNNTNAENDFILWAGATAPAKESLIYKNYSGQSQWYAVNNTTNDWALNSAVSGIDSFKAYQSTNSGDTYVNASNGTGHVRINYETGSGAETDIYSGGSSSMAAAFQSPTSIKLPGLASSSGRTCLQIDNSGFLSNTGGACNTVSSGSSGQIAFYSGNGNAISGVSSVPLSAGGTGATSAGTALVNLGAAALAGATFTGQVNAAVVEGSQYADQQQSPTMTGNNGIQMSINQCKSQAFVCQIFAPALYAQVEAQPWGSGNLLQPNVYQQFGPKGSDPVGCVTDYRWGGQQVLCNSGKAFDSSNRFVGSPMFSMNSTSVGSGMSPWFPSALYLTNAQFSGGRDFYYSETSSNVLKLRNQLNTMASSTLINGTTRQYAPSDNQALITFNLGVGIGLQQNEGYEFWHGRAGEMGSVYDGTLNSYSCAGNGDCTFALTQTNGMTGGMGDGLALIDLTNADTSGYVARISGNTITGSSGVDWSSSGSTTSTTTTASVADASAPNTFPRVNQVVSVGSSSGFSAGSTACFFDNQNPVWGCTKVTAVGSGTITLAEMHWPLTSGSLITTGGMTGMGFSLDADSTTNTNGKSFQPDDPPSGSTTIRVVYPIMTSAAGNALTLFNGTSGYSGSGNFSTYAYPQMGSGGTASVTVSGGVVTACSVAGGSGYPNTAAMGPPQLQFNWGGVTYTAAPVIYVSGTSGGALTGCTVASGGAGLSGTPAVSVVPVNAYHIFSQARAWQVYNPTTGGVDGTAVQTTAIAGTFNNGDSVEQPHYFANKEDGLNLSTWTYQSAGNHSNILFSTYGQFGNNDYEGVFKNWTAPAFYMNYPAAPSPYVVGNGQLTTPYGIALWGAHRNGLMMQMPPFGGSGNGFMGAVFVNCFDSVSNTNVCAKWNQSYPVLGVANANSGANDMLGYNPVSKSWTMTAGATGANGTNPACTYTFGPNGYTSSGTGCANTNTVNNAPAWLQYLGTGADATSNNANGNMAGEYYLTSFTVPYGNTVTVNATQGLTIHSTGSCTIAGSIIASGANGYTGQSGFGGGAAGGSGGGSAAGVVGVSSYSTSGLNQGKINGGTAGAASGGNGGNGASVSNYTQRLIASSGGGADGQFLSGANGPTGANSGGAGGYGGQGVTLICATINGSDGTHTGVIDVSGANGSPASANSSGSGAGGGGGVVILSAQNAIATMPVIYTAGGAGSLAQVPEALGMSGSCTQEPKLALGVSGGALSSCTVVQAGANCASGAGVNWNILGGGGAGGTVTPVWSGGSVTSCTASGGSGYSANTYTNAGTGGDGGNGWSAVFQGW